MMDLSLDMLSLRWYSTVKISLVSRLLALVNAYVLQQVRNRAWYRIGTQMHWNGLESHWLRLITVCKLTYNTNLQLSLELEYCG